MRHWLAVIMAAPSRRLVLQWPVDPRFWYAEDPTMQERESVLERFDRVPEELRVFEQWVNWRLDTGRKVPVNPATLGNAGVRWPNTWASFEKARESATRSHLGIGFVLTADDPYTCVDLDKCVDKTGEVSEEIRAILTLLNGYVELSPSGSGLHIWVKSEIPINRRTVGLEIYSSKRWITITGRSNPQVPPVIPERTAELKELVRLNFATEVRDSSSLYVELDDEDVWQRLFRSPNGTFFESLYRGDLSVCYNDHSRAVILLANHLARVTDLDAARIKRLLYQTGLVRPKWEERRGKSTWIDHQILNVIRYVARRG
jgi:putative DNA primase/helicase